jgi:hypothetical protein
MSFPLDAPTIVIDRTEMRWIAGTAVGLALLASSTDAYALCAAGQTLCEMFWSYDAVFDGTVLDIEHKPPDPEAPPSSRFPYRIVTFDVHRSWRGEPGPQLQLRLAGGRNPDGTSVLVGESFEFTVGGRYLVFASRFGETASYLTTSSCDPTAAVPSRSAAASLAFLDTLSRPSTGARITGGLYDEATRQDGQRWQPSLVSRVTIEGNGLRRTVTSAGGRYSFEGIQPGDYVISVDAPGYTGETTARVSIPDTHACADRSFYLRR